MSSLTNSQIATLRHVNERPGICQHTIGADYAAALQSAGMITIRRGKCYPTAAAAPYQGRSPSQIRSDRASAYATLMGRWSAA